MKNWSYTITEGEHKGKTLWSGRYCAVSAFIFCKFPDGWKVLANQRGKGTPDFQGMWNCPCGYLEPDESSTQGCAREAYEETGVKIHPMYFQPCHVETEPENCNHGNVTIRHYAILYYGKDNVSVSKEAVMSGGGEEDEVETIGWIDIKDLDKYEWAFDHRDTIIEVFDKYISSEYWEDIDEFDDECKMSLQEFFQAVELGYITSNDGIGLFATKDKVSNISAFGKFSLGLLGRLGVTHVCWYNK